jgi:arylformamidase
MAAKLHPIDDHAPYSHQQFGFYTMTLIDLSHDFADGMPGFSLKRDGEIKQFTASIRPFVTHEASAPFYDHQASFEITEVSFQTSIGTYIDAPRHRWKERRDIAQLKLDELILPGVMIDTGPINPGQQVNLDQIVLPDDIKGKAVLVRFGWDHHWGTDTYEQYPYLGRDVIDALIARGAALLGVDTFNVDTRADPARPAHSLLLKRDILIVENLRDLHLLPKDGFRFFAIPIKAVGAAAMTIRAFAEVSA